MDNLGYKKTLLGPFTAIGTDPEELIPGNKYMVDFYLPGGVTDMQQVYFVADGEDADKVLSQAYYEKHLSLIKRQEYTVIDDTAIKKPKSFTTLEKTEVLNQLDKATTDLLKDQKMPEVTELEGGLKK